MKKLFESALAVWNMASPTKRRWIILAAGFLLGVILVAWLR